TGPALSSGDGRRNEASDPSPPRADAPQAPGRPGARLAITHPGSGHARAPKKSVGRFRLIAVRGMGERVAGRFWYHGLAMQINQLNHVAIHVHDLDRSIRFYRDVLRLPPLDRPAFDF